MTFSTTYRFNSIVFPTFSSNTYRFGFNGKENDNEVKGDGNQQDYGMRIYDPRLGRFLSPDPIIVHGKKYAGLSTYQFASNTPIMAVDMDGLEMLPSLVPMIVTQKILVKTYKNIIENTVRYQMGEAYCKVGLGAGGSLITGKGQASDAYGTTFFNYSMASTFNPASDNSSGNVYVGFNIALSGSFMIDTQSDNFLESSKKVVTSISNLLGAGSKGKPSKYSFAEGIGTSFTFSEGIYGFSIDIGFGAGAGNTSPVITRAISLTTKDCDLVGTIKNNNENLSLYYKVSDNPNKDGTYDLLLTSMDGVVQKNTNIKLIKVDKNFYESLSYNKNKKEGKKTE